MQPLAVVRVVGGTTGEGVAQARDSSLTREVSTGMTAKSVGDGNDTDRLLDEQGVFVATSDVADLSASCNLHATTVVKAPLRSWMVG